MSLRLCVFGLSVLCACPEQKDAAQDRLEAKLQAEQARLREKTPIPATWPKLPVDPEASADPLAQQAAHPDSPVALSLSGPLDLDWNGLHLTVNAAATSQTVTNSKTSISVSEGAFLRVELTALATREVEADLSSVHVGSNGLALDAQKLAGTRALKKRLKTGESAQWVLYFELPRKTLENGTVLQFPLEGKKDLEVVLK